jgi:hypothetical protein
MGTNNKDTDPSSPGALRPRTPHVEALASTKPTTDPGLGPPSVSAVAPGRRSPVSVPPPSVRHGHGPNAITPPDLQPIAPPSPGFPSSFSSSSASTKDSVELLLEGMAGPRPDRRKTKPQSDGEASAVYHAEHGLRRARNSSEPGPKVVVERAASAAAAAPTPVLPRATPPGSREALSTFVPGRVLRRRVAVALVAGVLIVLLSFVGLRLTGGHRDGVGATNAQDPNGATIASPAASGATVEPSAIAAAPSSGTGEPIANAAPAGAQPAKAEAAIAATPAPEAPKTDVARPPAPETNGARTAASAHASSGPSTHHHEHASGAAAPAAPGDLGEFKTKF